MTDRQITRRAGETQSYPMAAGVTGDAGTIAVLDAAGYCSPVASAPGRDAVGLFARRVANAGADGAVAAPVDAGIFRLLNDGTDSVTGAHVGGPCWIAGEATVAADDDDGARGLAGTVTAVDDVGVWVAMGAAAVGGYVGRGAETVYALSGTEINARNGTIQTKTISGATTLTDSLTTGQSVTLILTDGDTAVVTWPPITWVGITAPALTGQDVIVLWKVGATLYGAYQGSTLA